MSASLSMTATALAERIGLRRWSRWIIRYLGLARQVRRERRMLAALDERQLDDIGLTRTDADTEASRDFLDVPYNRRSRLYL